MENKNTNLEISTLEGYILNELNALKAENADLKRQIEDLTKLAESKKENLQESKKKCIYLDDTINHYYTYNTSSYYHWNDILIANNETPELVRQALSDETALDKLCSLEEDYYSRILRISEYTYDYYFKCNNGHADVLVTATVDETSTRYIGEGYNAFLSLEEAKSNGKAEVLKIAKLYLDERHGYAKEFYEKLGKHSNKD